MSPIKQNAASESFNEIATVHIDLRHTDPLIWRQVEVPTSITLKVLHDIIQVVMGWFDYHLWEFRIGKQRYGLPMDDWGGAEPRIAADKVRLRDVLKPRKTMIDYTYDFGDCWEHRLAITDIRAGQPRVSYPRYIGAKETDRPTIAAASQGSMNCSKRSLILCIRAMPISKNGWATTIPLRSMCFRSNSRLVASQTAATRPRGASPRKSTSAQLLDSAGP
jgi:Plasmid pRiA4b ORF-3-like protein